MKTHNSGRQDFLLWINEFTECDYPKIELLSDGIGYCQIIDAIHPGAIQLQKLNFMARFPDEYSRNLKVLDDAFSKLKIDKVVPIDKLSKCKFQDNMTFLQWMFNYASKVGPFPKNYRGYQKRLDAFEKQHHGRYSQMSAHLIPNTEFLKFKQTDMDGRTFLKVEVTRAQQAEETVKELETDIKNKMEYNWKLIYALDDLQYQRDVLYGLLTKIDQCVVKSSDNLKNQSISQKNDQYMQFIELLCPIHNTQIQFLNIKSKVPKGERALCSKCTLNEPLDLEDSFKLWKNFQNSQKEKLTHEGTVQQLTYLSKQLHQLNSKINIQFNLIQEEINDLVQKVISQNQEKINHIINLENELNLSKLQTIATLLGGDEEIEVVDTSKYIQNLHSTIIYAIKEIILEEKCFLSQLEFEIIAAKRPIVPKGQFVDYTKVQSTLKQEEKCCALTFTFDNATLIAGCGNKIKLCKFENEKLQECQILDEHSGRILCLNSSKQKYMFISGSEDKFLKCWTKECGLWKCVQTLTHPAFVFCSLLSNDDNVIISGGSDGTITIWNDCQLSQTLAKHNGRVLAVSMNDSQNQFASCSNDKQIIIWQNISNDWKQKQTIKMEDKGFRISYIGDDMFVWQQFKVGTTHIFEQKNEKFVVTRTIELTKQQDGQCLFPTLYNKQKQILIQKHGGFVFILHKLQVKAEIECESEFVYGTLSQDGQNLVLWDECTLQFQIFRLNYQ